MRSVSLADPQGPRRRRAPGALSVSENENDLSRESVFYLGRKENTSFSTFVVLTRILTSKDFQRVALPQTLSKKQWKKTGD